MNPGRPTLRHIIKMLSFKDKERILKAARDKEEITCKGAPIRLAADFSTDRLHTGQERMAKSILGNEKQNLATKTTLPNEALN